jgi:cysteine desulfurase
MRVYLDHNATTPVDPAVLDAMLPFFSEAYGNASSIHSSGQRARAAVDAARESVARLISAKPAEIVFTSGGTEADNLALHGLAPGAPLPNARPHVITSAIEHHAVLNAAQALEKRGFAVTFVAVSGSGVIDPDAVRSAIRPETFLISVMHANNELGTLQPIEEIGRIAAEADIHFHTDAVQSAGKLPLDVNRLSADLLTLSAHKIYGPKGVGALYVRAGTPVAPQMFGGHHERDRRPGTENVPGIVGFGRAAELARKNLEVSSDTTARIEQLRDKLEQGILAAVPGTRVNGDPHRRVSNTTNISFDGVAGEAFVIALDLLGISVSTGAACSSGAIEPSHVLLGLGLTEEQAHSSIRFSLGRTNTAAEIDHTISAVKSAVERIRSLAPVHTTPAALR